MSNSLRSGDNIFVGSNGFIDLIHLNHINVKLKKNRACTIVETFIHQGIFGNQGTKHYHDFLAVSGTQRVEARRGEASRTELSEPIVLLPFAN